MNEEIIKKIAEEEFINNTMKHLDSALIFVYIKNLEKENAELRTDISARETICDDYKSRIDKAEDEIERLNNIINELEELLKQMLLHTKKPTILNNFEKNTIRITIEHIQNKLKELKDSD